MALSDFFRNLADKITTKIGPGTVIRVANSIAQDARENASWSSRIPGAISVEDVKREGFKFSATIIVDTNEETGAPEAAAFEYGSGIHKTKGTAGTYVIRPKEGKGALAFLWDKEPAGPGPKYLFTDPKTGKKLFRYVDHPGVAPRPYMQPAIAKNRGIAVELLKKIMIEEIRASFRSVKL